LLVKRRDILYIYIYIVAVEILGSRWCKREWTLEEKKVGILEHVWEEEKRRCVEGAA